MDGTRNAEPAVPDEGGEFDPKEAARILREATSEAQRSFDLKRPLIWVTGGAVTFLAYGALWFSVRDQHPYQGPSLAVIAGVYVVIIVAIAVSAKLLQRATKGVSGPSRALMAGEGVAVVSVGIAGLFVSAAASWAVVGIGLFAIALVAAVAKAWLQHRKLALT